MAMNIFPIKARAFISLLEKQHAETKCTNLNQGRHNDLSTDGT
jgi:hypothetical protein